MDDVLIQWKDRAEQDGLKKIMERLEAAKCDIEQQKVLVLEVNREVPWTSPRQI